MSPEDTLQPNAPTPSQLLIGRLLVMLLLGTVFAALFGDFVVWGLYGTQFILSARFHKVTPMFFGLGVVLMYSFLWQTKVHWKQRKFHLALLEFFVFLMGAMPAGLFCALLFRLFAAKGAAVLLHPMIAFLTALLLLIVACKCRALRTIWQLIRPAFNTQDQRRIVISK